MSAAIWFDCPHPECGKPGTVPDSGEAAWVCVHCGEDGRVCATCEAPNPTHGTDDEPYCAEHAPKFHLVDMSIPGARKAVLAFMAGEASTFPSWADRSSRESAVRTAMAFAPVHDLAILELHYGRNGELTGSRFTWEHLGCRRAS